MRGHDPEGPRHLLRIRARLDLNDHRLPRRRRCRYGGSRRGRIQLLPREQTKEQNDGKDPLSSVSVSDDSCSPLVAGLKTGGNQDNILDPGETWNYSCATTLTATTTNTATATGTDTLTGKTVTWCDPTLPDPANTVCDQDEQAAGHVLPHRVTNAAKNLSQNRSVPPGRRIVVLDVAAGRSSGWAPCKTGGGVRRREAVSWWCRGFETGSKRLSKPLSAGVRSPPPRSGAR